MKNPNQELKKVRAELTALKREHKRLRNAAEHACKGDPHDHLDVVCRRARLHATLKASR